MLFKERIKKWYKDLTRGEILEGLPEWAKKIFVIWFAIVLPIICTILFIYCIYSLIRFLVGGSQ